VCGKRGSGQAQEAAKIFVEQGFPPSGVFQISGIKNAKTSILDKR
jgi:hypothetical protein